MDPTDEMVCVILAGGQGKRMASTDLHKVCFPILGVPAIVRAIRTYKRASLKRFLVVVGQKGEQVIATIASEHPEVSFVYQDRPRGTGHAALMAVEALAVQGYRGPVMLIMGDKVTTPQVVRRLIRKFCQTSPDIVLTALPKRGETSAGRVVTDRSGNPLGVVELADIEHAQRTGKKIRIGRKRLSPDKVEKLARTVNASMYIARFEPLRDALMRLSSSNAQGEIYLTDVVADLAARGRTESLLLEGPADLMAFNTPGELLAVEEELRRRQKPSRIRIPARKRASTKALKTPGEWVRILTGNLRASRSRLSKFYGPEETLIDERRKEMVRLVNAFAKRFGNDRPMIICRAPGRINLMGRHVDHRGGYVNVMAISREVLLAASPREDSIVTLRNLRGKLFAPRRFTITEMLSEASWSEWVDFIASRSVRDVLESAPGDWSHYARAPLLRLQHECPEKPLRGMDCLVTGNIPMGAGLSSSSAMVVAFAQAAVALNGLDVEMHDFVDLCGEGEWFVGSRGGSADHAAISSSRKGYISRIGFYPFRIRQQVRFPSDLSVVIAHSGREAVKSGAAKDVFNHRVAAYEIAEMILRARWAVARGMEHLRDLTPDRLQVSNAEVYRGLMRLPNRPTRTQLRRIVPKEDRDRLTEIFATHSSIAPYDLRGVTMYGIGECIRSERFASMLSKGDLAALGRFMRVSHNGDRRFHFDRAGRAKSFIRRTDDAALKRLAERDVPLSDQPGRYGCSTEAVDNLVDIACATEGVVGAQLAGAGLGGCMMILARSGALETLLPRLRRDFYRPRGLRFDVHVACPVAGAGLVRP